MRNKTPLFLTLAAATALGACTTTSSYDPANPNANATGGAVAGALVGGLLGATSGGDERLTKGVAGAIVGGAIGGAIGSALDRQAAELQRDIGGNGTSVVNTGNQLIVTMPQDILFATDSAAVRPDLQQDLYTLASSLRNYPDTTVQVVGHTDNTGSADYNLNLSRQRANSVASILIGAGVPASRIVAVGRGEDQPIASNLTPEGRAQNRRVEFVITPNR